MEGKLLIKNGALIETDNDASYADDVEEHSFLVDAIDEVRLDKVAAYLQMGAIADFDATEYYNCDDQSVDLALERIEGKKDKESVSIIKQMIEDARNGKPRDEIRLENYEKGAEKQKEVIEKTNQQGENKMTDKTSTIEFVGAMDNPHFMEWHFNKESLTIGSKPLPKASEDEMKTIMDTMDKKALSIAQGQ